MAKSNLLVVGLLYILAAVTIATADSDDRRNEKGTTHLKFFIHDSPVAPEPTTVPVAGPSNTSATRFGMVYVVDDPITTSVDPKSTSVGRLQGMLAFSSQSELSASVYVNIIFTNNMYNGSQINFVGQYPFELQLRELPIVGGTKAFRFASGYAEFKTVKYDPKTGNSILEVNIFVYHY